MESKTALFGGILLVIFVLPGVILGLYLAPWFFFLMAIAIVVPLYFLIHEGMAEDEKQARHARR